MAKTFEYSMKIPFDMSDVNGYIKIPQLILLSLQVSGMQSIELGMSDMYILENYNLVWIITDYMLQNCIMQFKRRCFNDRSEDCTVH